MKIYGSGFSPLRHTNNKKTEIMTSSVIDLKETKSIEKVDHDLIRGDFTPDEALEILCYLIDKKINFHQVKTFTNEIRFGEVDKSSAKRCEELKQSKASIKEIVQLAKEQGHDLRIKSSVTIEIL
jgi:hypothetical protein